MAGIRDSETRRKLLALSPFPTLQNTINICRSEETAKANEKSLSTPQVISHVQTRHQGSARQSDISRCGSYGRLSHRTGETCPAAGKQCHTCGNNNHFFPCCPKKPKTYPLDGGGAGSGGSDGGGASSNGGNKHEGGRSREKEEKGKRSLRPLTKELQQASPSRLAPTFLDFYFLGTTASA
jgi:hypothetical protein